jgi:hypothetical protein
MFGQLEEDFQLFAAFFSFVEAITFGIGTTHYDLLCCLCLREAAPSEVTLTAVLHWIAIVFFFFSFLRFKTRVQFLRQSSISFECVYLFQMGFSLSRFFGGSGQSHNDFINAITRTALTCCCYYLLLATRRVCVCGCSNNALFISLISFVQIKIIK